MLLNLLEPNPEEREINRKVWTVFKRLANAGGFDRLDALPKTEQAVLTCLEMDGEVNNGGFDQYFYNSSGEHAAKALEGLAAIGATEAHGLLAEACSLFPGGMAPADRHRRWDEMAKWKKREERKLKELDMAYYALGRYAVAVKVHRFLSGHARHLLDACAQ